MKSKLSIGLGTLLVLALAALPALAGGSDCSGSKDQQASNVAHKGHDCTAETQVCLNAMAVKLRDKGWVGIEMDDADGTHRITRVEPDSPALAAGLREGDVLLAVNGLRLGDADEQAWSQVKSQMQVGNTLTYTIERGAREQQVAVTLAQIPDEVLAKWIGRHMLDHAQPTELAQN